MRFDADAIVAATGGVLHAGDREPPGGPIGTDTRADLSGAWFLALVGDRFDGHAFADRAEEAGAGGGVFSRRPDGWTAPWVEVPDTTAALQALGAAARRRLTGPVVGVAGCTGKTTTRELIACALAPLGPIHRTRANDNNHLGVPLTLLAADEAAAAAVVELGSSAPGEMAPLVAWSDPDVRVCLNIGPAHLEALGDLAGVRAEEGVGIDTAGPDHVVVVSADDPWLADVVSPGRVIRFGVADGADVRVEDVEVDVAGWRTTARLATPEGPVEVTLRVPGRHLAHNASAAVAVAMGVGVPVVAAAEALSAYRPVGARLRRVDVGGALTVIDDAYNANPTSMAASLALLGEADGPAVAVLGDMLELGPEEARYHAEVLADAVRTGRPTVVLGPRMHQAAADHPAVVRAGTPGEAARVVRDALPDGGVVLLKASRGMRLERVLGALTTEETAG